MIYILKCSHKTCILSGIDKAVCNRCHPPCTTGAISCVSTIGDPVSELVQMVCVLFVHSIFASKLIVQN